MRASLAQTTFTGGVLSPRLMGHTNMDRYGSGVKAALNCYPVLQGGMKRRGGTRYVRDADTDFLNYSALIPFFAGRSQAFMLEFGNGTVRVLSPSGSVVATLATPYSGALQPYELDWAQSDSTMYLFHPLYPPQRIQRLSASAWVFEPVPFTQLPYDETGAVPTTGLTLSAATVGAGRTATSGGAFFRPADVGRIITHEAGVARVTAYTSPTAVTVEITRAFPSVIVPLGQWVLDSSPQATLTPSAVGPVGAVVTLTLDVGGWRPADVGSMVRINGGLLKIRAVASDLSATAEVAQVLAGAVAAPPLAWSLEPLVWGGYFGYPRTGTIYQQRLIVAGAERYPRTVWGSRIGEPLDFERGTADDLGFAFTIDGDEASPISYVAALDQLAVFTESAEYTMRGGVEKPITPTNVAITPASGHGTANVRPESLDGEVVFVQRAGRKVRAFGYNFDFRRYESQDITILAEHLTAGGITQLAYQREPDQVLWARRTDGTLLSCTIDRGQSPAVVAWCPHDVGGFVESIAVLPGVGTDTVWMIVRRTVNGVTRRFIERFDDDLCPFHPTVSTTQIYGNTLDCAMVFDNDPGVATFTVPHLPNTAVRVLADGTDMGTFTTNGSGQLTLPRTSKRAVIGLHFDSWFDLLNPEVPTPSGTSQGQPARTGELWLNLLDSVGGAVVGIAGNRQTLPLKEAGPGVLRPDGGASVANAPVFVRGLVRVNVLGWDRGESPIRILQDKPYPMHVLSVIRGHQVNPK